MVPETTPGSKLAAARAIGRVAGLSPDVNIPNLITLARLLTVPFAVWLILEHSYGAAFWVFVAAGVSDALDGYIAKHFNRRTRLGAMLDPAADKLLLTSVYLTLGFGGQLPGWLVVIVVLRDALIVLGFAAIRVIAGVSDHFAPLLISKVNTFLQIALIGFVLARLGLGFEAGPVTWLLIVLTAATTTLSGFSYLWRWFRILRPPARVS
jgi:cardiolipin synthase